MQPSLVGSIRGFDPLPPPPPPPPAPSHLCSLRRSLINLTPRDGFLCQPSSEVMGIWSVTNIWCQYSAGYTVYAGGPPFASAYPLPSPPQMAMETRARVFFRVQVTALLFYCPVSHTPISVMGRCFFFFTAPSCSVNVYTTFPLQTWKVAACFCNVLSALIILASALVLRLWSADVIQTARTVHLQCGLDLTWSRNKIFAVESKQEMFCSDSELRGQRISL